MNPKNCHPEPYILAPQKIVILSAAKDLLSTIYDQPHLLDSEKIHHPAAFNRHPRAGSWPAPSPLSPQSHVLPATPPAGIGNSQDGSLTNDVNETLSNIPRPGRTRILKSMPDRGIYNP
jgi:hypothetical protein